MALAMCWKRSIFSVNGIIDQGGRTGIHDLLSEKHLKHLKLSDLDQKSLWQRILSHNSVTKLQF
jgi:hypothetical protein